VPDVEGALADTSDADIPFPWFEWGAKANKILQKHDEIMAFTKVQTGTTA
jgi:hypothetical protein